MFQLCLNKMLLTMKKLYLLIPIYIILMNYTTNYDITIVVNIIIYKIG